MLITYSRIDWSKIKIINRQINTYTTYTQTMLIKLVLGIIFFYRYIIYNHHNNKTCDIYIKKLIIG